MAHIVRNADELLAEPAFERLDCGLVWRVKLSSILPYQRYASFRLATSMTTTSICSLRTV